MSYDTSDCGTFDDRIAAPLDPEEVECPNCEGEGKVPQKCCEEKRINTETQCPFCCGERKICPDCEGGGVVIIGGAP